MQENKKDEEVAKRIEICRSCENLIQKINVCKKCGCFMPAKVRLRLAKCPIGKWEAIPIQPIG